MSLDVQALVSLQAVPPARAGFEQSPVAGSQTPTAWHWPSAAHATGLEPTHTPPAHASSCVQALLALHGVPSGAAGFEHVPVAGSHAPAAWHASDAAQTIGAAPVHTPPRQLLVWVQASPSSQGVPAAAGGLLHRPVTGSQ